METCWPGDRNCRGNYAFGQFFYSHCAAIRLALTRRSWEGKNLPFSVFPSLLFCFVSFIFVWFGLVFFFFTNETKDKRNHPTGGADPARLRGQRRLGDVPVVRGSRPGHTDRLAAAAPVLGADLPAGAARRRVHRARAARLRQRRARQRPRSAQGSLFAFAFFIFFYFFFLVIEMADAISRTGTGIGIFL